jgi:hypothetical protein
MVHAVSLAGQSESCGMAGICLPTLPAVSYRIYDYTTHTFPTQDPGAQEAQSF